jgi:serine phosphatase RsbU (regulator of sigma subunit)/anti-sigma regulatory factor (Ser/Thr protein kinase)
MGTIEEYKEANMLSTFRRSPRTHDVAKPEPVAEPVPMASPVEIPDHDPLMAYLFGAGGPIEVDKIELDSPALRELREAGVHLVVPLISQGELIGTLNLGPRLSDQPYSSDDRKLLAGLASQVAPAIRLAQLVAEQQAEAEDRERLAQELRVAALIQQTLLPKTLPDIPGWEIDAYYRPARAVGGDFYDFVSLEDGRFVVLIGDVTDKGVPAALVMAGCRSILRSAAQLHSDPGAILAHTNEALVVDIPPNMFVTCLCAVLDPKTNTMLFANAGHNLPYVQTAQGVEELVATGMPLGLMPDMEYDVKEATLEPGVSIVLSSDGLTEAHNPAREMFGFDRLRALLAAATGPGPKLLQRILTALDEFSAGVEQEDDVTLVVLRHTSSASSSAAAFDQDLADVAAAESFSVASVTGNERIVMDRVTQLVGAMGMSPERLERLGTAVAEATMNAIEHGNANREDLEVDISVERRAGRVHVTVADQGPAIDIPDSEAPDLEAKLAGLQSPRGWGLFLMKELVDDVITHDGDRGVIELVMAMEGDV